MRFCKFAITFFTIIAIVKAVKIQGTNNNGSTTAEVPTTPVTTASPITSSSQPTSETSPTSATSRKPDIEISIPTGDDYDYTNSTTIGNSINETSVSNATRPPIDSASNASSTETIKTTESSTVTSTPSTPTTTTSTSTSTSTVVSKDCVGCQEQCEDDSLVLTIILVFMGLLIVILFAVSIVFWRVKSKLNKVREQNHSNEMLQKTLAPKEQDAKELFDEKEDVLVHQQTGTIAHAKKFDKNDPATRERHRKYIAQCKQQELEDGDLRKFAKSGTIFIPHAVTDAAFTKKCEAPDNVMIEKVTYDPSGNEVFDIGSDVDNIELNPSTVGTSEVDTSKLSAEAKSSASRSKIKTKPKDKSQKSKSG